MTPPTMPGWNLALRFVMELVALVSIGVGAWSATDGAARWLAAVGLPLLAVVLWGTFNVPDDPSRSGKAPVAAPGWVRLLIELAIFAAGAVGLAVAGWPWLSAGYGLVVVLLYATSMPRVRWLLTQG